MSDRLEREPEGGGGEGRSSESMARLVGQMLMLPFSVFVYSMEAFARTIQGMQRAAEQGMDVMAGGVARPGQGAAGAPPPPVAPQKGGGWGELRLEKTSPAGDGTVGGAAEAKQKETVKMSDKNLSDDKLKLVRYKILFVKRDYEVAFDEREELVYDNMTGEAFTAWKVAEFIQRLPREEVPERWRKKGYPRAYPPDKHGEPRRTHYIKSLDEDDKKYLRVFYEVLDRYEREDEEAEVTVLKDIRDAIDRLPRINADRGRDDYYSLKRGHSAFASGHEAAEDEGAQSEDEKPYGQDDAL